MKRINCTSFDERSLATHGDCCHQAAPRRLFGTARCILLAPVSSDPRVAEPICRLQTPHAWLTPPKKPSAAPTTDALAELIVAAEGLCMGDDWNNGSQAKIHRPKLIAAMRKLAAAANRKP